MSRFKLASGCAAMVVLLSAAVLVKLRATPLAEAQSLQAPRGLGSPVELPDGDVLSFRASVDSENSSNVYSLERRSNDGVSRWRHAICAAPFEVGFTLDAILPDQSILMSAACKRCGESGDVFAIDPEGATERWYFRASDGTAGWLFDAHVDGSGGIRSTALGSRVGSHSLSLDSCVRWGQIRLLRESANLLPDGLDLSGEKWPDLVWAENAQGELLWTMHVGAHLGDIQSFEDGSLLLSGTMLYTLDLDGKTVLTAKNSVFSDVTPFLVRWSPEEGVRWARVVDANFGSDGYYAVRITDRDTILVASAFKGEVHLGDVGRIRSKFRGFGTLLAEFDGDGRPMWGRRIATGSSYPGGVVEAGGWIVVRGAPGYKMVVDEADKGDRAVTGPFSLVLERPEE